MATNKKKTAARPKTGKAAKPRNQPATRPIERDRKPRTESQREQRSSTEENLNPPAGIPFPNPTTPQRNPETQRDPQDRANHEQWEAEEPVPGGMHYSEPHDSSDDTQEIK